MSTATCTADIKLFGETASVAIQAGKAQGVPPEEAVRKDLPEYLRNARIQVAPTAQTESEPSMIEYRQGVPYIAGTGIKVVLIAEETALGRTPQQILEAHPHLTLAQIHSALAYYYAHQEVLDAERERRARFLEEAQAQATRQVTREELEARLQNRRQSA